MSAPDALVEAVARAMCARSRPHADPDRPTPAQRGAIGFVPVWQLFVPLAEAALAVIRPLFAQPSPEMVRGAVQGWLDTGLMSGAIAAAATVALGGTDADPR